MNQPSCILPSWIQPFWKKKLHSFILTQLDDGSHLEFCHLGFRHLVILHKTLTQTNSFSLNLMISAILNSAILDSAILHKKKLHSFILTQLDDGSHLEFCHVGFSTLPSWIQTPCYLLSDSLKNTLTPLWLWLKLIQSDSNSFILT